MTNKCVWCGIKFDDSEEMSDYCSPRCSDEHEHNCDYDDSFLDYGPVDSDPYDVDGPYY